MAHPSGNSSVFVEISLAPSNALHAENPDPESKAMQIRWLSVFSR
jgi:hypothetical protein